jgi:hypothetical protein
LIGSPLGAFPPPLAPEALDAEPDADPEAEPDAELDADELDADEPDPAELALGDDAAEPDPPDAALPPLLPHATAPKPRAITAPKTNVLRVNRAAIRRPSTTRNEGTSRPRLPRRFARGASGHRLLNAIS